MKYVYGAMLLHSAKQEINEENLKKVLSAANIEVDPAQVKAVVASLEGVNIDEVLKNAVAMPAAQPASGTSGEAKPKEGKKEEHKEEEKKSEEEAAAGLAALFG